MSLDKVELKKQLKEMGVKIEGNYVNRKHLQKILIVAAGESEKENYRSTIKCCDALIDVLEKSKPEEWSVAERHDIREYIEKHLKKALTDFWGRVGNLSSTLDSKSYDKTPYLQRRGEFGR